MAPAALYALAHGASWILPDGRVIKIPGFHSAWISSHPSIAPGAVNTAEFVKKTGWLSAVLHEGGYLELIIRSKTEARQRDCLWNLLSENAGILQRVVLMALDLDGCSVFKAEDIVSRESFDARLDAPPEAV